MTRYHVGASGEPGACRATKKPCPLGGDTPHFEAASMEEAREKAERLNTEAQSSSLEAKEPWEVEQETYLSRYSPEDLERLKQYSLFEPGEEPEPF